MSAQRAVITQLLPHLYLIDDAGESTCYLICGREKAMLIDTANGMEDLCAIVRTLTDLPLVVVNTHGHCDHIYGNAFFDEAYLHPADRQLASEHFAMFREDYDRRGLKACPFRDASIGQVFDLGGVTLEVVDLAGHTAGSIGLIAREDRILFSGDGVNPHIWMQLEESLSIAALQGMLQRLKADHGADFDRVLTGHAKDFRSADIVGELLQGCRELLSGQRGKDLPYHFFGGECLQHPITPVPGEVIVYTEDKL